MIKKIENNLGFIRKAENFKHTALFLLLFFSIYFLSLLFNSYPTLFAQKQTPPGMAFSGHAAWFDPWDLNVYYSVIRSGQHHGILLSNVYTTAYNAPVLFYPLYTISGMLFPNSDPITIYHSLAYITIFIFLGILFFSSFAFLKNYYLALLALLLLSRLRGLGGLLAGVYKSPDLYLTSITFRSAFQRPHEGIGTGLYILSMVFLYLYFKKGKLIYQFYAFLSNLLLLFFYPYYYLPYLLVYLGIVIINKETIRKQILPLFLNFLILVILAGCYYFYLQNSGFAEQSSEIQPKLTLLDLFTSYGILIPIFFYSISRIRNLKKDFTVIFLSLWVFIAVGLSYLPIGYSRFFLRGLFFPLIIIAVILIKDLVNEKFNIHRNLTIITVIVIFFVLQMFTSFYIFSERINSQNLNNSWFYFPVEYIQAFSFLDKVPSGGVLAEYETSNYIPVYTDDTVYAGHQVQTPDFDSKEILVDRFYASSMTNTEASEFLQKNNIKYVMYGLEESRYRQLQYPFLKRIYSNAKIEIFSTGL